MNEEVANTSPKHPLHKFPGLLTGDADELSGALSPFYGGPIVKPERDPTPFRAQLNICRLDRMSLGFGASATALKIDTDENPYFLHEFLVRGTVEHRNNGVVVAETPYKGAAGEPGSLNLSYGPNFELFTVFLNQNSVSDVLSGLIGAPASRKIKLERAGYPERPEPPMMRGLVRLLISELDREDCDVSPVLLAEMQQAILVAYLSGVDHNHSHLLNAPNKTLSSLLVRRAEEYIEANWREPISVEALALVINAGARNLFHTFKANRGYSPMYFVKQVRLKHANKMLAKPELGTSVTDVAFECGFGNLSHFASDYRKVFGEHPSETLRRARLTLGLPTTS
jgi:AraC-like DNA-binding protein